MSYRDNLLTIAAATVAAIEALTDQWEAGELPEEEFTALVAARVALGNTRSAALADLGLAAELTRAVGRDVLPLGLLPPTGDPDRLAKAVRVIVTDDPATVRMRLIRLADNEPKDTASTARGRGISRSRHTTGWTRGVNPAGCKACQGLAGPVLSKNTTMWRHAGCSCAQIPTTQEAP